MRLSKSGIGSYKFCPHQFWRQYVARDVPRKTAPALELGTRFHEFAETFFKFCDKYPQDEWDNFIPKEFSPLEVGMAAWFINNERNRYDYLTGNGKEDYFMPLCCEVKIDDKKNRLVGIIDRVDWADKERNEITLVEYKTSKKIDLLTLRREFGFYAYLWSLNEETIPVKGLIINPSVKDTAEIEITPRMIAGAKRDIEKVREAVYDIELPRKCSDAKFAVCGLCDIKDVQQIWGCESDGSTE